METLLGLAKAIPPDAWLVMSVLASAVVIGLHWVIAHLVGPDDIDTATQVDSEREFLGG